MLVLCVAVTFLALACVTVVLVRAWLRPAGVLRRGRYTLYGVVLAASVVSMAVAAIAHHSWVGAAWAAVAAVLTAVSVIGNMRRDAQRSLTLGRRR